MTSLYSKIDISNLFFSFSRLLFWSYFSLSIIFFQTLLFHYLRVKREGIEIEIYLIHSDISTFPLILSLSEQNAKTKENPKKKKKKLNSFPPSTKSVRSPTYLLLKNKTHGI